MRILDFTGFSGQTPLKIYISDYLGANKTFLGEIIEPSIIPITVPPFDGMDSIMVTVIDNNGCETFQVLPCIVSQTPTPTPTNTPTLTPTPTPTPTQP